MTAPAPGPPVVTITPRQREVIGHIMDDAATDQAIASRMGLDVETIHTHVRLAMKRIGARSRTHLVLMLSRREVLLRTENQSGGYWHDPQWREQRKAGAR